MIRRAVKAFGVTLGIPLLAMMLCLVLFSLMLAGGFFLMAVALGPMVGGVGAILVWQGAGWLSGFLAFVNLLMVLSPKLPKQLKKVHLARWAFYVVPGLLLLDLQHLIPLHISTRAIGVVCAAVIPFGVAAHFIYLLRTRQKLGIGFGSFRDFVASVRARPEPDTAWSCVRCRVALTSPVHICPYCGWTQPRCLDRGD